MSVNEKPFKYVASGGTEFTSPRSDFKGGLLIRRPKHHDELDGGEYDAALARAVMDMMSYFMIEVYPHLNGFSGWDAIEIKVED